MKFCDGVCCRLLVSTCCFGVIRFELEKRKAKSGRRTDLRLSSSAENPCSPLSRSTKAIALLEASIGYQCPHGSREWKGQDCAVCEMALCLRLQWVLMNGRISCTSHAGPLLPPTFPQIFSFPRIRPSNRRM